METIQKREAWNKGKLVGQKPPLKPKDIWAIRIMAVHPSGYYAWRNAPVTKRAQGEPALAGVDQAVLTGE